MKQKPVEMRQKMVRFTDAHFAFFDRYTKRGGNPSQLIRIALDKEIQRIEIEEKKIEQYNNLSK